MIAPAMVKVPPFNVTASIGLWLLRCALHAPSNAPMMSAVVAATMTCRVTVARGLDPVSGMRSLGPVRSDGWRVCSCRRAIGGSKVDRIGYDVQRPPFHLFVNPTDVLAEDSRHDELS